MAGFKVKIGANTVELTKSLAELRKDLAQFKKQLSTTTNAQDFVKLNQQIQQTERQIKSLSGAQSINALNTSIRQLPAGANQATTALGNLGRVASDAPFGFIAISNNIEPLIQSFVYLKQQSGSTGAAMKALGSSLLGGGGLLLAFSLATSALTFFASNMGGAKKELEGFAKAQSEANQEAGEEIANLRVLAAVAANTTNSGKERREAAEQLSKSLKAQNVQLSEEEALNNRAAKAIETATKAILERAKARAIENRIAELTSQNLDRESKRFDLNEKIIAQQKTINTLEAQSAQQRRVVNAPALGLAKIAVESLKKQVVELDGETSKATAEINRLLTSATQAPTDTKDPVVDLLKQRIDALKKLQTEAGLAHEQTVELAQLEIQLARRDGIKQGFTKEEIQQQIDAIIQKAFGNERLDARFKLRVLGEIDASETKKAVLTAADIQKGKPLDINAAFGLDAIDPTVFDPLINKMKEASAAKNELARTEKLKEMGSFVANTLQPAFSDLFEAIISGGNNAFQEFAKAIGRIITRLIAAAASAALLAGIITLITGGTSAGAASFLSNFKGLFSSLTGFKFAEGGIATRPTFGVFGEQGPEAVIPLARLPQIIGQAGGGGGTGGEFTAKIVDGGRDLLIIMNRANKTYNRNF